MSLHDDRCSSKKGFGCNCAAAAFRPQQIRDLEASIPKEGTNGHNNVEWIRAALALMSNKEADLWHKNRCRLERDKGGESLTMVELAQLGLRVLKGELT